MLGNEEFGNNTTVTSQGTIYLKTTFKSTIETDYMFAISHNLKSSSKIS